MTILGMLLLILVIFLVISCFLGDEGCAWILLVLAGVAAFLFLAIDIMPKLLH